jgi:hypothetical protein
MIKRNISGWSRIGIVLSIAGALGSFAQRSHFEARARELFFENDRELCQLAQSHGQRPGVDCVETFGRDKLRLDLIALAAIPLPAAFMFAWLALVLFR